MHPLSCCCRFSFALRFPLGLSINNTQKCTHAGRETEPSPPTLYPLSQDASLGFPKEHCARGLPRYEIHDNSSWLDFHLSTRKVFTSANFQLLNNATLPIITVLVLTSHGRGPTVTFSSDHVTGNASNTAAASPKLYFAQWLSCGCVARRVVNIVML